MSVLPPSMSRRPPARLAILLAFGLCLALGARGAPRAHAEEVIETYDDGSPKAKYTTNAQGQKEGRYVTYHPNGKVSVEATYRADLLEGAYAAWSENGKPSARTVYKAGRKSGMSEEFSDSGDLTFSGTYADDLLHGRVERFREKKSVSVQIWRQGELVTLEGITVHPKSLETIRKTVASIFAGEVTPQTPKGKAKPHKPAAAPEEPGGELAAKRTEALRRLQVYRFLCGVPYADLRLGEKENDLAQAAAEISALNGRIEHDPPNPGLSEEHYRLAVAGASKCNLMGEDLATSVDAYFRDSDERNAKRVGHRRWCLNPAMVVAGFGDATDADSKSYSAMWATDSSRTQIPDYDAVCYPTQGYMPLDLFGPERLWSVSPNPQKFPGRLRESSVQVRVYRLPPDFVRPEKPLDLARLAVNNEAGSGPCVIFRPKVVDLEEGAAYWVEVFGLDPKAKQPAGRTPKVAEPSLRYLVHFCGPATPIVPEGAVEEPK